MCSSCSSWHWFHGKLLHQQKPPSMQTLWKKQALMMRIELLPPSVQKALLEQLLDAE